MAQNFSPATPSDGPAWLPRFAASIADLFRRIMPAPLRLKDYATANLPATADFVQGIAYNLTNLRVTYSNGSAWVELQPYDATLAALAALDATPGILVETAADTFTKRSLQPPAAGITITNPAGTAGNPTFALANDLAALEALAGTNTIYYRSGVDTWSAVTIGASVSFSAGTLDRAALTGDVTASAGSNATTLATVNANTGAWGSATQSAQITLDGKGRATAAANVTITPAASSITGGAALTKVDDTNVTLTLGGTPTTALLVAASLTLGWTGQLSVARGGTSFTSYTIGDLIQASATGTLAKLAAVATGNVLISGGVGVVSSWGKVGLTTHVSGTLPIANGGTNQTALGNITKTDDTNVTLTLGGTPNGAVITATSFTLGWTGQLAVTRGGSGLSSSVLGDIWYGSGANTMAALAGNTTATKKWLTQTGTGTVSAIPAWGTIAQADVSGLTTADSPLFSGLTISGTGSLATFQGKVNHTGNAAGSAANMIFRGTSGGATSATGLRLLDTDDSHTVRVVCNSNLTANRTLSLASGDADRSLDISAADVTITAAGATFLATPSSANFASLLTDEVGTGSVAFEAAAPFTPSLLFGGGNTGMACTQAGRYKRIGNTVIGACSFVLTTKGSSTGNATITGLPFTSGAAPLSSGICIPVGLVSVASALWVIQPSGTTVTLYDGGTGNIVALTEGDFVNGSELYFSFAYPV